ncbi:hypothetical protein R1sor_020835 [Riccia sorocarpa]|uniref:Actin-related protein 8 n=1 Tax=Riccia sorocarpa TaxID=122646 RepID=A0ABD3GHF6_9MARC
MVQLSKRQHTLNTALSSLRLAKCITPCFGKGELRSTHASDERHLISERGSDVVVINFGSANLRVGLATDNAAIVVPHCIAHHLLTKESTDGESLRTRGAIGEQLSTPPAVPKPERGEISKMVELQLKMKPLNPDHEGLSEDAEAQRWRTLEIDEDRAFQWTQVVEAESDEEEDGLVTTEKVFGTTRDEPKTPPSISPEKGEENDNDTETDPHPTEEDKPVKVEQQIHDIMEQDEDSPKPSEKGTPRENASGTSSSDSEKQEGSDSEIPLEVRLTADDPAVDSDINNPRKRRLTYRGFICGEEALKIPATEPYILRRPICRGRFNVNPRYSFQQVYDDMVSIWNWVLTEKLALNRDIRYQYSVVLVVPDTFDNREMKEVLTIVLKDLKFRAAVVHQECVAATFGNGISSACVVDMGAQITSIVCIEDGVALPSTRIILPFGGEDISRCLLWVQRRWQTWPRLDTDPLADSLDLQMLESIKEERCLILEGEQQGVVDIYCREAGQPTRVFKAYLKGLNVPVMGLFYPTLLAPEEYPSLRPWFYVDHEDYLDDSFHGEQVKRPEAMDLAPTMASNGVGLPVAGALSSDVSIEIDDTGANPTIDDAAMGLAQAIVISILSTGRADIQKKLFASIQLVGGVALTRGLVDAVEERVLHGIPAHEAVDTVAVLQNRTDAPVTCWKGGAVLGILDFQREAWVQADEWVSGGVRIGGGRKYRDSLTLQSQALWYNTNPE